MSGENASTASNSPVPGEAASVTSQEQWQNFRAHQWGQWRGILLRYDGAGNLLDVLDSVRSFTPFEDQRSVTHALDFRSRMTEAVTQKQWVLTPGNPLITHPVDPEGDLLFNQNAPSVMVGKDRISPKGFYFEPYLIAEQKRVSLVVMHTGDNVAHPNRFSLFREFKEGEAESWWSAETHCAIASVAEFKLPESVAGLKVSLDELSRSSITPQTVEVEGEFVQYQFPDAIRLTVSLDRFASPYYALTTWQSDEQATQGCVLTYRQPHQKAEVWALSSP